jgi:hypothetical protein
LAKVSNNRIARSAITGENIRYSWKKYVGLVNSLNSFQQVVDGDMFSQSFQNTCLIVDGHRIFEIMRDDVVGKLVE